MEYTIRVIKTIGNIDLDYERYAKSKKARDSLIQHELDLIETLERDNWQIMVNGKEHAKGSKFEN